MCILSLNLTFKFHACQRLLFTLNANLQCWQQGLYLTSWKRCPLRGPALCGLGVYLCSVRSCWFSSTSISLNNASWYLPSVSCFVSPSPLPLPYCLRFLSWESRLWRSSQRSTQLHCSRPGRWHPSCLSWTSFL